MAEQYKPNLGNTIEGDARRDAIHIAVAPVVAEYELRKGDRVGVDPSGTKASLYYEPAVGVVDPFLDAGVVKSGQKFWLFLFPETITGLRHAWTHPAFPPPQTGKLDPALPGGAGAESTDLDPMHPNHAWAARAASEAWLREYANLHCPYDADNGNAYEEFMSRVRDGEIFYQGDDLHSLGGCDRPDELFSHLSVVLGRAVTPDGFTFSCSC